MFWPPIIRWLQLNRQLLCQVSNSLNKALCFVTLALYTHHFGLKNWFQHIAQSKKSKKAVQNLFFPYSFFSLKIYIIFSYSVYWQLLDSIHLPIIYEKLILKFTPVLTCTNPEPFLYQIGYLWYCFIFLHTKRTLVITRVLEKINFWLLSLWELWCTSRSL